MIIEVKSKLKLIYLFACLGEVSNGLHKFHKGNLSILLFINTSENLNGQRIVLHLRDLKEFIEGNISFVISI